MLSPERFWRGDHFASTRILVLGESWYDEDVHLSECIRAWSACARGANADRTFARIAWTINGSTTRPRDAALRLQAWQAVAFYNFAGNVGPDRSCRPTAQRLRDSCIPLSAVLAEIKPQRAWILGKEQSAYSGPVIRAAGVAVEITPHPTSFGLRNADLAASWQRVLAAGEAQR